MGGGVVELPGVAEGLSGVGGLGLDWGKDCWVQDKIGANWLGWPRDHLPLYGEEDTWVNPYYI